jgi:protein SPA2
MYLEAQSDQLVHSIQATLSLVRMTPTPPALDEHLAQIVTIVASIVAVFKDSIPPNASSPTAKTVGPLITELSEQVDRLSELQGMEKTKETRNQMAKSSFQIANALKQLLKI